MILNFEVMEVSIIDQVQIDLSSLYDIIEYYGIHK